MEVVLMKKSSQIAGLCGFVLLIFGLVEFLFQREFSPYTIVHLAGGGALLLFSLAFNLGGFWSSLGERSTRYSANAVLYTVIFLAILVLVNFVASTHPLRKDLTEGGLFSLSDQSQKVLDNLKEDVQVLAFFQAGKGTRLEDLLKNYANYSPRFTYEFIDPVEHPEKAHQHEVNTTDILVVKCGDRETKIPGTTEEDITNAILKVANPLKKKILFLMTHGERGLDDEESAGYYVAKKALENENYEVLPLELYMMKEVPEDTSVLVVASPEKRLDKGELDAIERYIDRGGNALFLMDAGSSPGLGPFLAKWGVAVGDNVVVDQVFRLFYGPALGVDPVVADYGAHDITKDFDGQTLFHMARSVDLANPLPPGVTGVSLAKTSASSWAETDLERFFSKSEVARSEQDLGGPVSIAVALTVEAKGNGGRQEGDEAGAEGLAGQSGKGKEARVVVFGDAAFIDNEYISKMYNADLFLNTVNWLAEEEALISIRPKTTRGSRVLMTPQETRDIFYMSVLILPEGLLLFGLAVWWRRR
jgi:ABC-type uncharacterized transport system involved in gliding motility auxiliary subunit